MKQCPSIPNQINKSQDFYCFDKLDGSNIRAEWSRKNGFYKFGTRKRMLDDSDDQFPDVPSLILEKFGEDLERISRKNNFNRTVYFFEYYGPNSFAGFHCEDDIKTLSLIDLSIYKKVLLLPKEFLNKFGNLDIAKLLYHGKVGSEFITLVRDRKLNGMTFEGVVCKAFNRKKPGLPSMFKIKSQAWYDKLKEKYKDDLETYERLK